MPGFYNPLSLYVIHSVSTTLCFYNPLSCYVMHTQLLCNTFSFHAMSPSFYAVPSVSMQYLQFPRSVAHNVTAAKEEGSTKSYLPLRWEVRKLERTLCLWIFMCRRREHGVVNSGVSRRTNKTHQIFSTRFLYASAEVVMDTWVMGKLLLEFWIVSLCCFVDRYLPIPFFTLKKETVRRCTLSE
jgi:hypothetical protein